jgi:SAM-dependent methyltransferase
MATLEIGHRLRSGPSQVWQLLNDWWLNIDTASDRDALSEAARLGEPDDEREPYQGANYLYLEQIAGLITENAPHRLVFYDVGCGKGRPLCVMAQHPFEKVVGVEVRAELCEVARQNARDMRGRVAPIEIRCADAASVDYSDGHVFFLFHPFGPSTLQAVLDSIERSLQASPRAVTLIYYHAVHEAVLGLCPWLECYGLLPTFSGVRVSFWRNRVASDAQRGVA